MRANAPRAAMTREAIAITLDYLICPFVREPHTLRIGGLTFKVRATPSAPVRKSLSANDDVPASK
jgi:hypothetical protein